MGNLSSHIVGQRGGGVQDQHQERATLDVSEEGVPKAAVLVSPRHQPRDVSNCRKGKGEGINSGMAKNVRDLNNLKLE